MGNLIDGKRLLPDAQRSRFFVKGFGQGETARRVRRLAGTVGILPSVPFIDVSNHAFDCITLVNGGKGLFVDSMGDIVRFEDVYGTA